MKNTNQRRAAPTSSGSCALHALTFLAFALFTAVLLGII